MRKSTHLVALAVAVMAVPVAVYASHQFDDVPSSHTFHSSISWMKDNGITIGCNPPRQRSLLPRRSGDTGPDVGVLGEDRRVPGRRCGHARR
jgi:hypothetical protein